MKITNNFGQSLVELLLTIGLTSILLPALLTGLVTSRQGKAQQTQRVYAVALLRETQEAVRSIRNRDWSSIEVNGTYHPVVSGTQWASVSGTLTINDFTKSYTVGDVNRLNGVIVPTPTGTLDPSTKKVIITVSWTKPYSSSISTSLYFTRWRDNLSYLETTKPQFDAGTNTGTTTRLSSAHPIPTPNDGEILLGSGGHSDWCAPSIDVNTLNLPKNGVGKAISAIQGQVFAGTGENSSGVSFANISITNTFPPAPSIAGTFNGYKTNGVFGETDYAYLATDTNSKEIVIVDLTTNPYSELGYFDAPGNGNGNSVLTTGNVGYMTMGNKLYNFDLSSKSGSRPVLDSNGVVVSLFGTAKKAYIVNNYAYVAISSNALIELAIVDISNPTNLQLVGWADVNGESAQEVYVNNTGTRAYLTTNESSSKKEFFIIDVSTKTGSRPTVGNYEANGMSPKGVALVPGNRAILVGSGGEEYQVIDISNEAIPIRCGGVDLNITINGVSSILESDNDAYSYIISDSDPEFRIIEGGPGGGYTTQGTFESEIFNPGYQTAGNRFVANFSQPSGTAIQFQVALANLVLGNCPSTFTFTGQDGTSNTWFPLTPTPGITTYSAAFPLGTYSPNYSNPGQCFRYKVKMDTTDTSQTPVLYDFTINYSP